MVALLGCNGGGGRFSTQTPNATTVYTSQFNNLHDSFTTFHSICASPQLNFTRIYKHILRTCAKKCEASAPEQVVVLSCNDIADSTLDDVEWNTLNHLYNEHGYSLPNLTIWNTTPSATTIERRGHVTILHGHNQVLTRCFLEYGNMTSQNLLEVIYSDDRYTLSK